MHRFSSAETSYNVIFLSKLMKFHGPDLKIERDGWPSMFIDGLFWIDKQGTILDICPFVEEWTMKMSMYTMVMYSSIKKNGITKFAKFTK